MPAKARERMPSSSGRSVPVTTTSRSPALIFMAAAVRVSTGCRRLRNTTFSTDTLTAMTSASTTAMSAIWARRARSMLSNDRPSTADPTGTSPARMAP